MRNCPPFLLLLGATFILPPAAVGEESNGLTWETQAVLSAPEAHQAAAADERFVYAIANKEIAKYDRSTGQRLALSSGAAQHLNSGFLSGGKLYCAHSNYPQTPERSEIKVLDVESMELTTFKDFGNFGGSLTWAVRYQDHWWCNFARYGSDNASTFLVQFDEQWREQGRWTYPAEVIRQIGQMSLSGGVWRAGSLLVTDHDHPVLYQLELPEQGTVLKFVQTQAAPFTGQGIALDPLTGGLVGINRAKRQIVFAAAGPSQPESHKLLSLHPDNPHYFLWRGKPTVVVTSAEHYGAVLNLDFDYKVYFAELNKHGLNNTRLFSGTYCESPESFNITENTLAPRPGKFVCPWARSPTPGAADGGNKFDLTRFDDAYFARLKDFLTEAGRQGIIVELDLFCPMYNAGQWRLCPMNAANNVNGVGNSTLEDVLTLKHADLTEVQIAVTRKIVQELKDFDNLYYEICNEPYANRRVPMEFQKRIIDVVVETEKGFPQQHLISLNIANGQARVVDPHPAVSIFNFHYCVPPQVVDQNYGLNKLIGENETGFRGSRGSDDVLYRTEGWAFLLAGGGLYNNLDYSFTAAKPDGSFTEHRSPGGGTPALRAQLGILKRFMDGLDFIHMRPDNAVVKSVSGELWHEALSRPGQTYAIYLYPKMTQPFNLCETIAPPGRIEADLALALPSGQYRAEWIDTKTGETARTDALDHAAGDAKLHSPPFENDIALRITAR